MKGKAPPLRVYLSPHLDDAVLSCGGAIHHQVSAGEPVLVITLFAGEPPAEASLSPFALVQHGYWGNPLRPMALRRAEDLAALTLLGAEVKHLDFVDAVYRASADGQWLYTGEEAIFGELQPTDPLVLNDAQVLVDCLTDLIPLENRLAVYAPLGAGHHVDHQVVHAAARQLVGKGYRLAFYEDYPYAHRPDVVAAALAAAGGENWPVEVRSLAPSDLMAKVSALAYYRTQMAILFGGAEAMPSQVWACAATCSPGDGLAERIFWPLRD